MSSGSPGDFLARNSRRLIAVAVVFLCVIAVLGWPVYVRPQTDVPRGADAIFVLGGGGDEPYTLALEYALEGYAGHVVFSNPNGADAVWLVDLCEHRRYPFEVSCIEPDPPTTRGEARALRRLAEINQWHSVMVITWVPHISRARWIIRRCFDGELVMVASGPNLSPPDWGWNYVYQTAGYVRAALQSGC